MARLQFDFADPAIERLFPAHGWALNSQNIRLLWLPIVRNLHRAGELRQATGLGKPLTENDWTRPALAA